MSFRGPWAGWFVLTLCLPAPARAGGSDALVQVVGDIVVRVIVYGAVFAIAPDEEPSTGSVLPDWSAAAQGEHARGCGLELEGSLTGTARYNYLKVEAHNTRSSWAGIEPARVTLAGKSLLVRPDTPDAPLLPAHFRSAFGYRLPKSSFEDARRLDVVLPVRLPNDERCSVTLHLRRDPSAPLEDRTFTSYSARELSIGVNAHFAAQGSLQQFASDPGAGVSLAWARYFRPRTGITFNVGLDQLDHFQGHAQLGGYFLTGFVYRVYPSTRFALSYELGMGGYVLPSSGDDRSNWAFLVRQKLKLELLPGDLAAHPFSVGPALMHGVFPIVGPTAGGTGQLLSLGLDFTIGG